MTKKINMEWLRRRIEGDLDVEVEAGLPIVNPEVLQAFIPGKSAKDVIHHDAARRNPETGIALATLLRQLRRRDNKDISALAIELRVPEDELRAIEEDKGFMPKPRTIHQIAEHYDVSARALIKLSPATAERDPSLDEAALLFAASSESLAKLSKAERKNLNEFVKLLSKYKEKSG